MSRPSYRQPSYHPRGRYNLGTCRWDKLHSANQYRNCGPHERRGRFHASCVIGRDVRPIVNTPAARPHTSALGESLVVASIACTVSENRPNNETESSLHIVTSLTLDLSQDAAMQEVVVNAGLPVLHKLSVVVFGE